MKPCSTYHRDCTRCPRLAKALATIRREHPDYHGLPVAPFGADRAQLVVVGLAPGKHGANRTGRPFTGDFAGKVLFETLYHFGYASAAQSEPGDSLTLRNCRITNAVKCWPPGNKPSTAEVDTCNRYLRCELRTQLPENAVVLALGQIAHRAVLKATGATLAQYPFEHGAVHRLADFTLVDSYHCSRQNVQTGRLTRAAFHRVFRLIDRLL